VWVYGGYRRRRLSLSEGLYRVGLGPLTIMIISGNQYDYTSETHESKRLPAGSLSIREYDSIIPVHGSADMGARNGVIYGFVL
jgi:hypothetical protein